MDILITLINSFHIVQIIQNIMLCPKVYEIIICQLKLKLKI